MLVPLDRLYDFLDQFVDDDIVIYRFNPHGSRKISDISLLHCYPQFQNGYSYCTSILPMLMHDQEPLNFDLYEITDANEILQMLQAQNFPVEFFNDKYKLDSLIGIYRSYNLEIFNGIYLSDKWLLCHSEKKSVELNKYKSLGAVGVYWWSHAMIARDWYRYAKVDKRLDYSEINFQKDFNVYSRSWTGTREYRLKFTEMVLTNNLVPYTAIGLSEFDNGCHYTEKKPKNNLFNVHTDLSTLVPNLTTSDASADYSYEDYQNCAIDVVLETLFDDNRLHLTEKILRPISCGKPFLLAAPPGSLQYLRDYGFLTFGEYIDETYDNIVNPLERLTAIIQVMKDVASLSRDQKITLHSKLHSISGLNKQWFWSDKFANKILDEFKTNYKQSYAICKSSIFGQKWLLHRKTLAGISNEFRQRLCTDNHIRSRKDIVEILIKIKEQNII